jgi:hypothetical protein
MKRPNKIDWLIYHLFRWWWNPILIKNPHLIYGIKTEFEKWLERNHGGRTLKE